MAILLCLVQTASAVAAKSPEKTASGDFFGPSDIYTGEIALESLQPHREITLVTTPTASGRQVWLSPDPIGEAGGLNLYGFVGSDPLKAVDPLGLAWEITPTQGLHYNDRKSKFGFKLESADGKTCAVPMGGKHTFDQAKADKILRKSMAREGTWKGLVDLVDDAHGSSGFKNKNYLKNLGDSMKLGGAIGIAIGAIYGVERLRKKVAPICTKIQNGEQLSDNDKFEFLQAVDESGVPGKDAIGVQFGVTYF